MTLQEFSTQCAAKAKEFKLDVSQLRTSFYRWTYTDKPTENNGSTCECIIYLKNEKSVSFSGKSPEEAFLDLEHKIKLAEIRKTQPEELIF